MVVMGQGMVTQKIDLNTGFEELYTQYNWFANSYPQAVQKASDEFFLPGFKFGLLGISKNINTLMDKDGYFVTKVRIDENYDMFFRVSEQAVGLILEKILGRPNSKFNLNKITDLEAKIITAFNDFTYNSISEFLTPTQPTVKRTNFDVIHLTFIVKDIDNDKSAKFIITLPSEMLKPEIITCKETRFENEYFAQTEVLTTIVIGSSRFKMLDVKNVESGDIIVLENSNINEMLLKYKNYKKEIKLTPDMELEIHVEGGGNMSENNNINLWDSIEVDMIAQFDAVKMSLGELKKVDEGLVIDLTSIFDNKVTLKVDDKLIAKGELVIVNDRYGVRVTEVLASKNSISKIDTQQESVVDEPEENIDEEINEEGNENLIQDFEENETQPENNENTNEEEEFDYSDFELEDEDI